MVSYDFHLFMLKKLNLDRRNKLPAIPYFPPGSFAVHIGDHLRFGIICGPISGHLRSNISGSFPVWGSFAVRDHFRSSLGIISGLGIICGRGSFASLYSTGHPTQNGFSWWQKQVDFSKQREVTWGN